MNTNTTEDLNKKCKNCGHTKSEHYGVVITEPGCSNPKSLVGVCKKCECKKFEEINKVSYY